MIAKISLVLNILLAIAVAILFMRSTGQKSSHSEIPGELIPAGRAFQDTGATRAPIVAFVNGDSINEKYAFIAEKTAGLEAGLKKANTKVEAEYQKRQAEAAELMKYAQGKQLPEDEQRVIQDRLMQLEEEMAVIEEQEKGALLKKEEELQRELQKRVHEYLGSYSKEKGIDYVLNYQEGIQLILFGNQAYDVTSEVLKGLNEDYEVEKQKK